MKYGLFCSEFFTDHFYEVHFGPSGPTYAIFDFQKKNYFLNYIRFFALDQRNRSSLSGKNLFFLDMAVLLSLSRARSDDSLAMSHGP